MATDKRTTLFGATFLSALLMATLSKADLSMIGGEDVNPAEHTAVFGMKLEGDDSDAYCTAFLVAPRLLLTAAHCVQSIKSIKILANGTDINKRKTSGTEVSHGEPNSYPGFVKAYPEMPQEERERNARIDIGYIPLLEDPGIDPLPLYVTTDAPSMLALSLLETTLVGYGATEFLGIDPEYYRSAVKGVKHMGKKILTNVMEGYVMLAGEKNGVLPGDSGGPEIATIDGVAKVFGINHGMQGAVIATTTSRVIKKGPNKGQTVTETKKTIDNSKYGSSIGTLLTKSNLCWVVKDSGQRIPGVDCSGQ